MEPKTNDPMAALLDEVSDAVYVCDCETYALLYQNKSARNIHAQPVEQASKCYEFIYAAKHPCSFCQFSQRSYDTFYVRKVDNLEDGRTFELRSRLIDWNGRRAHVAYLTDVTEQTLTRALLQTEKNNCELQNKFIAALYANMPGGVIWYTMGADPQIRYCNEKTVELLGYRTKEELIASAGFLCWNTSIPTTGSRPLRCTAAPGATMKGRK